jgi:hypothetical protein
MVGESKPDKHRARAAACQTQADSTNDPCLKRQIEEVAERWRLLAEQAERIERVVHEVHDEKSSETPQQDTCICPQCGSAMRIVRNVPQEGKLLELLILQCTACDHVVTVEVEG